MINRIFLISIIAITVLFSFSALDQKIFAELFTITPIPVSIGTVSSFSPSLATDGTDLHVTWADGSAGNDAILFSTSTDGGTTWSVPVNVSNNDLADASSPSLATDGTDLHVTWVDGTAGIRDILYSTSTDGGTTWSVPVNVSNNYPADSVSPSLATDGTDLHVTWADDTNTANNDILFSTSTDGGTTWSVPDNVNINAGNSVSPSLATDGTNVFVIWSDDTANAGNQEILFSTAVIDSAGGCAALIICNIGEVQWLETSYPNSGTGVVRVTDPDMNLDPENVDNFVINVWSDSDAGGINLTVSETNDATGIFEGTIFFSTIHGSSGHRLMIAEGDTVTAEYEDNTLPDPYTTADELDITATSLISSPKIILSGDLDELQGQVIPVKNHSPGVIRLHENIDVYFPTSNQLREKIKGTNLEVKPIFLDKFEVYEEKIILRKFTEITISDNIEFVSVFGKDSKTFVNPIKITKDDETIIIDDNFIINQINELKNKCSGNDAREYCDMSQQDIKNNIVDKLGTHTIQEEFVVYNKHQKQYADFDFPTNVLSEERNFFGANNSYPDYHFTSVIPNHDLTDTVFPFANALQSGATVNGESKSQAMFLNGFTLGHGYSWNLERDWQYNDIMVFESNVSAFVGLGIGLRIPIEITINSDSKDHGELEYSVNLFDATIDQFGEILEASQVFSGEEFVLELGPEVEASVDFLGIPVKEFSLQDEILGNKLPGGSDFDPSLGIGNGPEKFLEEEIPCNLSHLCQELGVVTLSLSPGVIGKISGNDLTIKLTNTHSTESDVLHFSVESPNTIKHFFDSVQNVSAYSIKIDDISYDSKIIIIPMLHGVIDLGLFSFLPGIGQGIDETIELYEIEFDHIKLENHDGTEPSQTIMVQDTRTTDGEQSNTGMMSDGTIETADNDLATPGCVDTEIGCYTPNTTTVDVGGKVIMTNVDTTGIHTFTSGTVDGFAASPDGIFDTGFLNAGDSYEWVADTEGEIPYYCMLHVWMQGVIIVEEAEEEETMMEEVELMVTISDSAVEDKTQVDLEFSELHVNYKITATQNDKIILQEIKHAMEMTTSHMVDAVGSDESPINIEIVSLGIGPPDAEEDWTGPLGPVASTQVVPEFGTIAMMILAVAIISIVAVTAKSRVVPRF